jgi:[ribosomal protein S5]-alanine N-acetyltransferase
MPESESEFPSIETPRMRLVVCTAPMLEALLRGHRSLGQFLGVEVPLLWSEYGDEIFEFTLKKVREKPMDAPWWSYLAVLKAENRLIGSCGYKGPPDKEGLVEIGYEIAEEYRGFGLATETARALIDYAFGFPRVRAVKANTLAEVNASGSVLQKCGMKKVAELFDPDEGEVWQWRVNRQDS